jgi:hypothetical protein
MSVEGLAATSGVVAAIVVSSQQRGLALLRMP